MAKCNMLALRLWGTSHAKMKTQTAPRVGDVQIPRAVGKSPPASTSLAGILAADQDMVNYFTIEMTMWPHETPHARRL